MYFVRYLCWVCTGHLNFSVELAGIEMHATNSSQPFVTASSTLRQLAKPLPLDFPQPTHDLWRPSCKATPLANRTPRAVPISKELFSTPLTEAPRRASSQANSRTMAKKPMRLPPLRVLRVRNPNKQDGNPCVTVMSTVLGRYRAVGSIWRPRSVRDGRCHR